MRDKTKNRLVYSTESGKICPACQYPIAECLCKENSSSGSGDGIIRIGRETKGRKGKGVTVVSGLPGNESDLKKLAKKLKSICSCGGAVKNRVIEIQGDHRSLLARELEKMGWQVKISGR